MQSFQNIRRIRFREMIACDKLQIIELKLENPTTATSNQIVPLWNATVPLWKGESYAAVLSESELFIKIFGHQPNTDSGFPE